MGIIQSLLNLQYRAKCHSQAASTTPSPAKIHEATKFPPIISSGWIFVKQLCFGEPDFAKTGFAKGKRPVVQIPVQNCAFSKYSVIEKAYSTSTKASKSF